MPQLTVRLTITGSNSTSNPTVFNNKRIDITYETTTGQITNVLFPFGLSSNTLTIDGTVMFPESDITLDNYIQQCISESNGISSTNGTLRYYLINGNDYGQSIFYSLDDSMTTGIVIGFVETLFPTVSSRESINSLFSMDLLYNNIGRSITINTSIANVTEDIPCIAEGQRILTPAGYRRIEELRQGDLIKTADGRHVHAKIYRTVVEKTTKATAPVQIGCLRVSPTHAFKINAHGWQFPSIAVKHGLAGAVQETPGSRVVYYHVETPNYLTDNLMVEGREIESFGANYVKKNGLDAAKIYYQSKTGPWFHRISSGAAISRRIC